MYAWLLSVAIAAAPTDPSPPSAQSNPQPGAQSAPQPTPQPAPQSPEDRAKLERDIARELGAVPPSTQAPSAAPAPTATPPVQADATGGNPFARLLLMPDVSAIGRANLSYVSPVTGERSPRDLPFDAPGRVRAVFEELELGLQAVVDPYARADVFIGFGSDGVEVEEAYATWLNLPYGFQARGGKLFAPFGRINTQHPHTWEFADRPLALQRLLAPEAIGGPGIDVSWLAPLSWFSEYHLAYQSVVPAATGATGTRPAGFLRAAQFFDVGESTTVGAGASAAFIDEEPGVRDLVGGDLYVKRRLATTGAYLSLQGEALARRLAGVESLPGGWEWGMYAQAVLRPDRRHGYGVRFERAPSVFEGAGGGDFRTSGLFFYDLSEFQRLRFQAAWDRLPGGANGFEAIALLEFSIGAHGAHPF
jgi:hypothetical protein